MRNWADTLAAYRFLDNEAVTHEQIMLPHWMGTRQEAMQRSRVLLAADTTDINLPAMRQPRVWVPLDVATKHRASSSTRFWQWMPIRSSCLAVCIKNPFVRQPVPKGETKAQRKKRVRESQVWERSIQAIGPVPEKQKWIYVGDRGSDIYTFWQRCQELGYDFDIRVAQDRRVLLGEEQDAQDPEVQRLKTLARSFRLKVELFPLTW
jgi:hypothetical protein